MRQFVGSPVVISNLRPLKLTIGGEFVVPANRREIDWDRQIEQAIIRYMARHNGGYPFACRTSQYVWTQLFMNPRTDPLIRRGVTKEGQGFHLYRGMVLYWQLTEVTYSLLPEKEVRQKTNSTKDLK